MTDFLLIQTPDGGELPIENGEPAMTDGIETAVFLSLFGGNSDDPGLPGNSQKQWWGNLVEGDAKGHYRSRTQYLLRTLPSTSGNLRRIEDAALTDLAWMVEELGAEISVSASIPGIGRVLLAVDVTVDGRKYPMTFERPANS